VTPTAAPSAPDASGTDSPMDGPGTPRSSTSASSAAPATTAGEATDGASDATAAPGGDDAGPSPTAPAGSPSPAESASPGPDPSAADSDEVPRPAPPGIYDYATTGESQLGDQPAQPLPAVTTLEVFAPVNGAKQSRRRDMRGADGNGSVTTTMMEHAGDGTWLTGLLLQTTVEVFGSQFTDTRDLSAMPPALIVGTELTVGDVATFHLEGDDMVADGTMTFTGREDIIVGTTVVTTNVIDVDITFSGSVEGRSDSTWWVRPGDLLLVQEVATSEGSQGSVTFRSSSESRMTSLTPH